MAKETAGTSDSAYRIIKDINEGIFAPVYLLEGEEPYYVDLVADAIVANALGDDERDFNQLIVYGADTTVEDVIGNARRYPMFAERSLVVVKEAQALKNIDALSVYTDAPLDSTVLVLVYRGKFDKRKALYKSISKNGIVLESNPVRDYEMARWITDYYAARGLGIEPDAAALLAESVGTDLHRVAVETEKLLKNKPEGSSSVTVADIEANVGISREFSVFELTRQLSYRQADKALRTAAYMGSSAKFAMAPTVAALFNHFDRILKYEALLLRTSNPSPDEKKAALGVNPFFFREYDTAVKNYPLKRCMAIIALLRDYDFKGKGGDAGEATAPELLTELITRILY
ncbi:MAG: DNA polymerase III subunit delta [Bacteroidales bacterium]|nr:DNA polymerase III subunit delta [Candidatus Hennigimonas equi]